MRDVDENDVLREAYRLGYEDRAHERDFDPGHALDLRTEPAVERVKALVDAWSDPDWSGRDAAAPFVRALRNALNPE